MPPVHVPPHNEEAEKSLLGAILIDRDAIVNVAEITKSDHFYFQNHKEIFEAMVKLYDARSAIDVVTLSNELKKRKQFKSSGGASYLAELSTLVPTSAHVVEYAKIVKQLYTKRALITLATEVNELAFDDSKETNDILDKAESDIFALSYNETKGGFLPLRDALASSFERLDELQRNSGQLRGVPTGFADLDRVLAGFQNSNLIILAARPGTGKTAFSLNVAQAAAVKYKKKIAFFSLEMSKEELVDRLLVAQADIDAWKLKTGRLDDQDFLKISDAMGVLAEAPIYIDDTPGMSIFEMRTKARRLMAEHGIDMIVVDYLQLAQGRTKDNRVQEVGEISQGLKNLARELKVPVLSLAQLSRAVESRGEKVPQLSDLRESGSIEQDADVVMFLYRKDDDIRDSVSLKIAKHRNGALADVELYFQGDRIRFYGMESRRLT
ncbi:MAG: replicative DNA helicase [Patescibacteria group bacterium]